MAVSLEIDDGNPWWLSPDLWTVPGSDPTASPGAPIVGQPCYIWARVHNRGTDAVSNATVRFWWANPGTNFDRNTATLVGTAYVSLNAGESQEVLCLTAWDPVFVNGGHECIVGEAFEASLDPLPPGPDFSVPTDRHVAQRNLTVIVSAGSRWVLPFEVHNRGRSRAEFKIGAEAGNIDALRHLLPTLGKSIGSRLTSGKIKRIGLARTLCPADADVKGDEDTIELAAGQRAGYSLVVEATGGATLVHVTQREGAKVVGGLSLLVIHEGGPAR